jgi:hypothetical protein
MKTLPIILLALVLSISCGHDPKSSARYEGKYCSGAGDVNYLRLIDESFAFLNPNPVVPNLSMIYEPEWGTFVEGAGWNAWWIQNSYGFSYAATPFLREPWFSTLQNSWDLFWNNQGDGKRMGDPFSDGKPGALMSLVAPDGSLGDAARPTNIIYKQGDGDFSMHDWFYEADAAGLVMQAEILLTSRDLKAIEYYLPKMERTCDLIERVRDPKNNLFLVGPACNLLAPSYGGVKQPDGTFGKGYLTGISINYLAALDRMVELYKMTGDNAKIEEYGRRQKITRESLPQLLTPAGYFVKSVEQGGIKHGVLGQEHYGYLEGVANADAAGLRVVDNKTAESIYNQIAAFPEIRPFDFLLTNAPGLDDTYRNWGGRDLESIFEFGCWVNGGVWGTVEGRAILMYSRLGKFEDIYRSGIRNMKWSKDIRMDAPWTQRGENTSNNWYDKGFWLHGEGVAVMVDNFAIPAATIRGLFDYDYKSDRLVLRPRIPGTITEYTQKEPVRFGQKNLYLSCRNGGPDVKSVKVNGKKLKITSPGEIDLMYAELPEAAKIEIVTEGGWPKEEATADYPVIPALVTENAQKSDLPDSLKSQFATLTEFDKLLTKESGAEYDRDLVTAAIESFEAYQYRAGLDVGPGYYRPIDEQRKHAMVRSFAKAAKGMYRGVEKRMEDYDKQGDPKQKHIAELFLEVKGKTMK